MSDAQIQVYLSNEQALLAWMRTAFAVSAVGILVVKLHATNDEGGVSSRTTKLLGIGVCLSALLMMGVGTWKYSKTNKILGKTAYQEWMMYAVTSVVFVFLAAVVVWLA